MTKSDVSVTIKLRCGMKHGGTGFMTAQINFSYRKEFDDMKRQIKNLICGICLVAVFTFAFAGVANAQTCTTWRCRMQSVISNYFPNGSSSSNRSFIKIIKNKYNSGSSNNTSSGNTNTSQGNGSGSSTTPDAPTTISSYAQTMLRLVNEEREANGLSKLTWNAELAKVAQAKAQDMVDNNYFSHTSPTYGSPFDMMKSFGIKYRYAAENIAKNSSVEKAHVALMNSEGHRKNILNANYTGIGIGIVKTSSNSYTIVQMFIG